MQSGLGCGQMLMNILSDVMKQMSF